MIKIKENINLEELKKFKFKKADYIEEEEI